MGCVGDVNYHPYERAREIFPMSWNSVGQYGIFSRDGEGAGLRFGGRVGVRLYDVWQLRLGSVGFISPMSSWCRFLVFKVGMGIGVIEVGQPHFFGCSCLDCRLGRCLGELG